MEIEEPQCGFLFFVGFFCNEKHLEGIFHGSSGKIVLVPPDCGIETEMNGTL